MKDPKMKDAYYVVVVLVIAVLFLMPILSTLL